MMATDGPVTTRVTEDQTEAMNAGLMKQTFKGDNQGGGYGRPQQYGQQRPRQHNNKVADMKQTF